MRVLEIDLESRKWQSHNLDEKTKSKFIGGSGLGAKFLFDRTDGKTDALGPDNPLIFMTGPFTNTKVPTSGRHAVVTKSPLTGIYNESDVGGGWGSSLKASGYDGIIVSGKSDGPVYLWIKDDQIEVRDASQIWGKDTYELDNLLKNETSRRSSVLSIGPAGEKLVRFAAIMTEGKHARAAARAGVGAVMGSKLLKAIVVSGSHKTPIHDPDGLSNSLKDILPKIKESTLSMSKYGTAAGVANLNELGDLPIKNWLLGKWDEGAEKISGETMQKTILKNRYHCKSCPIGCGRVVEVDKGQFAPVNGAGPEYETVASLGSLCLIDNLEAIAKGNELCNRYGLDTISTGAVIAFAIEAFEKGLITNVDTGGIVLRWGDPIIMLSLIKQIAFKEGIGSLLSRGVRSAAKELGGIANEFAIHVKGLELPGHDPRAHNSVALAYATSNRGACHLQAFSHPFERSFPIPDLGYPELHPRFDIEGKAEFTAKLQNLMCVMDSLKLCKFLLKAVDLKTIVKWIYQITGWETNLDELMHIGERLYNLKRIYNVKCGITRKDDVLPYRIMTHKRGAGGAAENLPHLGKMLSDYYYYRGWDEFGVPKKEKLLELDLEEEAKSITW